MNAVVLESVLTARETMPMDACQYFYECRSCNALLRPRLGDCCVFYSFDSVQCPRVQAQRGCCG